MRTAKRLLLALLLVAGALSPAGCGSGGGGGEAFPLGAYLYALPFLPDGQAQVAELCLANLADREASVQVRAFDPTGAPYPGTPVIEMLPALGSLFRPLGAYTGGANNGGWLEVETRDPLALDAVLGTPTPTATSGRVVAALQRTVNLGDGETTPGIPLQGEPVYLTVLPQVASLQLINASYVPNPAGATPETVDFDVDFYDEDGDPVGGISVPVPGGGSVTISPLVSFGMVSARPATGLGQSASALTEFLYALAALENNGQVQIDTRLVEVSGRFARDIGFDLSFGTDGDGNVHDFAFPISNPTDDAQTVIFRSVRAADGTALLSNAAVPLAPHQTKYVATSTLLSMGLDPGEASPLDAAFGPVGSFPGFRQLQVEVRRPAGVQVGARDHDPVSGGHYRIANGLALSNLFYAKLGVSPVLPSAMRHYTTFMNRTDAPRTVLIRAFTPGGTEYILPSVDVPPFGRIDWSPDGTVFREVPGDTQGPALTMLGFRFTANGGLFWGAREEKRQANDLLVFVRPSLVYNADPE